VGFVAATLWSVISYHILETTSSGFYSFLRSHKFLLRYEFQELPIRSSALLVCKRKSLILTVAAVTIASQPWARVPQICLHPCPWPWAIEPLNRQDTGKCGWNHILPWESYSWSPSNLTFQPLPPPPRVTRRESWKIGHCTRNRVVLWTWRPGIEPMVICLLWFGKRTLGKACYCMRNPVDSHSTIMSLYNSSWHDHDYDHEQL
jgi:hypothetical protein